MSLTVLLWLQSGAPALGYVNEQAFSPLHFHGINGLPNVASVTLTIGWTVQKFPVK